MEPRVSIIMGSTSDLPVMEAAAKTEKSSGSKKSVTVKKKSVKKK